MCYKVVRKFVRQGSAIPRKYLFAKEIVGDTIPMGMKFSRGKPKPLIKLMTSEIIFL